MMGERANRERRVHANLRGLVERAQPLQKAAIRWGARRMEPRDIAELDARVAQPEQAPVRPEGMEGREHILRAFDSATPREKMAIWYVVRKMGPEKVAELEALVGRNSGVLNGRKPGV